MKIGIYGAARGEISEESREKARIVGRELAKLGHEIVTGGCAGLPYEAALGAKEGGGKTIAYSSALDLEDHKERFNYPVEGYDEFVFIPQDYEYKDNKQICFKYRNVSSVAAIDAAIIIGGRIGTMNEFTGAYDAGKNIGVLEGSGGITGESIKVLLKEANKDCGGQVIFEKDPVILVNRLLEQ